MSIVPRKNRIAISDCRGCDECICQLYKLPRFSEDIDFILKKSDSNFSWQKYLNQLTGAFPHSSRRVFKVMDLVGMQWVEVNIADQLKQIGLFSTNDGFESILK